MVLVGAGREFATGVHIPDDFFPVDHMDIGFFVSVVKRAISDGRMRFDFVEEGGLESGAL